MNMRAFFRWEIPWVHWLRYVTVSMHDVTDQSQSHQGLFDDTYRVFFGQTRSSGVRSVMSLQV